jgi:hypothetical protein
VLDALRAAAPLGHGSRLLDHQIGLRREPRDVD